MRPQWQDSPGRRTELLERVGFVLRRETSRFEWRSESGLPAAARRLDFHTLDDVGEEAFVSAIERVSNGTLDREIKDERDEFGPAEAARRFFELERKLEYDQAWCRLAYATDGELVGLVMPARNPTSAVINFIGVVPEHRGRGYVDDLLVEEPRPSTPPEQSVSGRTPIPETYQWLSPSGEQDTWSTQRGASTA